MPLQRPGGDGRRHRATEFKKFLTKIEAQVRKDAAAYAEAHGGHLAVVWNRYDTDIPWVRRFQDLIAPDFGDVAHPQSFEGNDARWLAHRDPDDGGWRRVALRRGNKKGVPLF